MPGITRCRPWNLRRPPDPTRWNARCKVTVMRARSSVTAALVTFAALAATSVAWTTQASPSAHRKALPGDRWA